MKRSTFIILAIMAALAGGVSCSKDNVIDKDPLSTVALSIIPDFSDGSVYSYSDDGSFFLRVAVTPEEYLDKFGNDGKYIYRADFRKVITKASPEDPDFTVVGEITSVSVEEGYLTASFTLSEDEMTKIWDADYAVSFAVKAKDGSNGFMTAFVPVSWYTRDGSGGDEDEEVVDLEAVDMGLSVKWANMNLGAKNPGGKGDLYAWGATKPLTDCPYLISDHRVIKYAPNESSMHIYWGGDGLPDNKTVLELMDDAAASELGGEWRMPDRKEFEELYENCDLEWAEIHNTFGVKFTSRKNGNSIFLPATIHDEDYYYRPRAIPSYISKIEIEGGIVYARKLAAKYQLESAMYWTSSLSRISPEYASYLHYDIDGKFQIEPTLRFNVLSIRPVYGKVDVAGVTLNSGSVQLDMGESLPLTASVHPSNAFDNGIVWSSSDPNVASVDAQGNVKGVSAGEAIIEVKTNDGGFTATCKVTVAPKAVDLGLSVKWAAVNLDASAPEASGDYYAWGATAPNPGGNYSWSKCPYCSDGYGEKFSKYVPMGKMSYWGGGGSPDNKRKLEPGDDAAAAKLGGKWRTPTSAEFEELFKSCDTEWTTVNDVNGLKFTSRTNGNSIFLPATGHRNGSSLYDAGEEGLYMSSSLATDIPDHSESLKLSSIGARGTTVKRNCGLTVRAVTE